MAQNEDLKAKNQALHQEVQQLRKLRDKQRRQIRNLEKKTSLPPSVKKAAAVIDQYLDANEDFPKQGKGKKDAEIIKSLSNRIPQHAEFKIPGGIKLNGKNTF